MRKQTVNKYQKMQNRFNELYKVERKRIDDCEVALMEEFFLSKATIRRVLKIDIKTIDQQVSDYEK